jgi:hypothetical protein
VTDARPQIDWQPASVVGERERGLRDDPGRIVLLIVAVGLLLGGLMPWAEGKDPAGLPIAYTPQAGLAEGYLLLVSALILAVLAAGRVLVENSSRTVQLLPLAVAIVAVAMWLGADRASLLHIEEWTSGGGFGVQTVWRTVTAVAIVGILAGTIWLELTRPADTRARTRGLVAEWRPSRVGFTEALVAGALGIVGALIGGALTIVALGPNGSIFAVFVSLVGMAAGISAGVGIVRWATGGGDRGSSDGGSPTTASKQKVSVSRVIRRRS